MSLAVEPKIFEQFPDLVIGILVARGINNTNSANISELIEIEGERIKVEFDLETLAEHPGIKCWREAYASFRGKPTKNNSSVETLYRLVLNGTGLRSINPVVDIYNYISLKHMFPLGGDDLDSIDGSIQLRYAEGNERFQTLNTKDVCSPKAGEVIYADNTDVLCRRWNWRECNKSKMTNNTRNVALVVESLAPGNQSEVETALSELKSLVQLNCGGEFESFIVNQAAPEYSF